jgi:hypothetical protein
MLIVRHGVYFSELGAIPQRKALDDGILDVRILRSGARLPKANAFGHWYARMHPRLRWWRFAMLMPAT